MNSESVEAEAAAAAGELQLNSQSSREHPEKTLEMRFGTLSRHHGSQRIAHPPSNVVVWSGYGSEDENRDVLDANTESGWVFYAIECCCFPRIIITVTDKWELEKQIIKRSYVVVNG